MAPRSVERLLNVIMTIGSRRRIDRARLMSVIPEYAEAAGEAREKMFERDKAQIRALGIPLVAETDPFDPHIVHYRIDSSAEGDHLDLDSAEYTVLLAASRAWDDAAAGGAARRVRAKLQTFSQSVDESLLDGAGQGRLESLPVLSPLLDAAAEGSAVSFRYRTADGRLAERTVEPWAVGVVDGHWYVLGHDRDREGERVFRASRIESFPRHRGAALAERPDGVSLERALHGIDSSADHAPSLLAAEPWKVLSLREELGASPEEETLALPSRSRAAVQRLVRAHSRWLVLEEPVSWRRDLAQLFREVEELHAGIVNAEAVDVAPQRAPARIRVTPTGTDHLARLIAIASHVQQRSEVSLDDLAQRFGLTRRQVIDDLSVLFLCGDLGAGWEDLIEAEWDGDIVRVRNAEPLRRSFRPTEQEAVALLAGLGALGPLQGRERQAADSVRQKLTRLISSEHSPGARSSHDAPRHGDRIITAVRKALRQGEVLEILYSPPDRPGAQRRLVRPLALWPRGGRTYLRAELEDGQERSFRIDRIAAAGAPDAPADADSSTEDLGPEVPPGIGGREDEAVWLRLEGPGLWIAEAFEAVELRDGGEAGTFARLDRPVRSALLDAVMEAGGAAEVLAPPALRARIAQAASAARSRHDRVDR